MSMVEKVARALVLSRGGVHAASDRLWPETVRQHYELCAALPNYEMGSSLITDAFRDARTAIEAMREPTPEMLGAWLSVYTGMQYETQGHLRPFIWEAMIDAALGPSKEGV